jgi:hypothetical protein
VSSSNVSFRRRDPVAFGVIVRFYTRRLLQLSTLGLGTSSARHETLLQWEIVAMADALEVGRAQHREGEVAVARRVGRCTKLCTLADYQLRI